MPGTIDFSLAMDLLKKSGWSSYRIRKEKLITESTLQRMREGRPITTASIRRLCEALSCQPGDLMEYRKEDEDVR